MSDSKKLPFNFSMTMNTQDGVSGEPLQEKRDKPFSIAMMGDFSAHADDAGQSTIADLNFIEIDRYNFDEVFASMALQLSLSLDQGSATVEVPLQQFKDFHPDNLYKNVEEFSQLSDLRNRLNNPKTFKQAIEELGLPVQEEPATSQDEVVTSEKSQMTSNTVELPQDLSGGGLLDAILGETENNAGISNKTSAANTVTDSASKSLVDALVQHIMANKPDTVSRDARQDELVASVDEKITFLMRSLLHHPQFQALEAAWRGVYFMVKRIRDNKVKLYLLDVSRHELAKDLDRDDVTQSQLYNQFCDTAVGDIDWSLIIGDYRFGVDIDDMLELSQLGIIAQQAGASFIAAADENLVGCSSFAETPKADDWQYAISEPVAEAWEILRKSAVAKNISLALPRFMLRMPYGKKTAKVDAFSFEEMTDSPQHEDYLWGNPAFLKAEQIARAFQLSGWEMEFAKVMNTEDLPLHFYPQNGQTVVKPCAEISLTDNGASRMITQGLIPLWSVKNSDRIHSGDFHSIAE